MNPSRPSPDIPLQHSLALLPEQGAPDLLFLLLHGDGADGRQMEPLALALRREYPQAAVVALDAPLALPSQNVAGWRWFDADAADQGAALQAALPGFVARVRAWGALFGLPWPRVALAGFSQGGQMALEAVVAEPHLAGRVLAIAAAPLARPQAAPEGVCLHLLHGLDDAEVPKQHVLDAARTWVGLGADLTADLLPGVGHELHAQLIERGIHQLRHFIPAHLWREAVQQAAEMDAADRELMSRGRPH
ncbi:MAG: esterase [Burkholderiales bacterium]|uniref:esterase n=1 Tax=Inhella sp. TaxID=1921806 RepID=UPI001ACF6491|nr:esterase [Burkholderiales bacterium]